MVEEVLVRGVWQELMLDPVYSRGLLFSSRLIQDPAMIGKVPYNVF